MALVLALSCLSAPLEANAVTNLLLLLLSDDVEVPLSMFVGAEVTVCVVGNIKAFVTIAMFGLDEKKAIDVAVSNSEAVNDLASAAEPVIGPLRIQIY